MELINIDRDVTDESYRYKMPKLIVKVEEGKDLSMKTEIVNMVDVAKALSRSPAYPTKYIGFELDVKTKNDFRKARHVVNGSHDVAELQQLLDGFIKRFVLCEECCCPETDLIVDKKAQNIKTQCTACGHLTYVDMRHKVSAFILQCHPMKDKGAKKDMKASMSKGEKAAVSVGDSGHDQAGPSVDAQQDLMAMLQRASGGTVEARSEEKATEKKSTEEIEAALRKMIGKEPSNKMTEMKDTHEIEADLKRMLNMPPKVVVTKEDLLNVKVGKNVKETKKPPEKKKEKKTKHPEVDHPHHHHRQHQEEPLTAVTQDESQTTSKKKKKKPKKKKTKDPTAGLESNDQDRRDSEDSDVDEDRPPPQKQFNLDFHRAKYLDDQLTPAILNELESEKMFPLKKKSTKFANAKYFCRLCEYHCDNIPVCRQHANDARHRRKKEIMLQDKMLKNLPLPSERHIEALDDVVESIFRDHGLTDEDMAYRQTVADQIQDLLREKLPDVSLCMFGSSLTGLGLKTADLNMDLVLPAGANPAICLSEVYRTLCHLEEFTNVKSDFLAKVPSVLFTSPCGTLQCQITVGSEQACQTSQYLAIYLRLDERMRKLAVTFKYWAKVCEVDNQDRGSLPAYCFGLMTIFYLQQCQPPVLPVLWKDLSEQALKRPKTKADVQNMLEELKEEVWITKNEHTVGTIWKDLLMFYGVHFDLAENIISVRSQKVIPRAEKKWKSRRIAIEDPFANKRNVARSLHNLRMFDYFYNCLRKTGLYFSLPTSHQNISKYYECKRRTSHKAKEIEKQSRSQSAGSCKISEVQTGSELTESSAMPVGEKPGNSTENTNESAEQVSDCEIEDGRCNEVEETDVTKKSDLRNSTETDSDFSIKENLFFEECKLVSFTGSSELESSYSKAETDDDKGLGLAQFEKLTVKDKEILVEDNKSDDIETNDSTCESCAVNRSQSVIVEDSQCSNVPDCDTLITSNQITGADNNSETSASECPNSQILENRPISSDISEGSKLENGTFNERISDSGGETEEVKVSCNDETAKQIVTDVVDEVLESVIDTCDKEIVGTERTIEKEEKDQIDKEIKDITGKDVHAAKESDASSESSSDSDMEAESPDSSPLLNRKKRVSSPVGAEYDFMFDSNTFTDGKGPSVFCPICEKEGHLKTNCPDDQLPPLEELPPLTKIHLQMLTSVIKQVPEDFRLSSQEIKDREFVRKNLEIHIQQLYPDAQLRLFGSSMNGFGFHQSDLDICVTFKDKEAEDVNFVEHIEAICKSLKMHRGLYAVFPITTAKVPIVKFTHRNSQLEGDISMYNILAMENTRLLSTYAGVDPRVQTLGYAIKVFAKVCDIGDASRGSLSSYAYTLMLIHYLQHTRPPLIPVLQELHPADNPNPQHIVEGWNTWFYDEIRNLPYVWPGCGKNNQCVGELWLGFFSYYLEEFNFAEQVVTVRQYQPLTKFEKLWNGKCVAIEDPFDLGHNLGGGLTRKMNHYIQCTFVNARRLYGTCIKGKPDGYSTIQDYFFDQQQLVTGELPSDRLCRVCGKIGHIAKECPRLVARKEREAAERKRREEMKKAEEGSPQKNPGPRQYNNRDRQNTPRSLSDPLNGGSPAKGHGQGQQQFYQRQNSQPNNQSPDTRQRGAPISDRYNGNYQGPGSPRQDFQPQFGSNRRPQGNLPRNQAAQGNTNHGYRQQQGYRNQPYQQYYSDNRNENSGQRYYNQGQNRDWNGSQYFVNQNYDLRSQRNFVQQGDNLNYPSSPTRNQHPPQFRKQFYEGSPQVYVYPGNPESGGRPSVIFTNPPFNIPINVLPSVPPVFSNTSMALNHAYQQSLAQSATRPPMVSLQNNGIPVCAPGWFPPFIPVSVCDEQPGQKTSPEQEVNLLETGQTSESQSTERKVNVQKAGNRGKVPDVGITVKNEFFSSKDQ